MSIRAERAAQKKAPAQVAQVAQVPEKKRSLWNIFSWFKRLS
jgi:hypothetical protein